MKIQKIIRLITLNLGLLTVVALSGATAAFAYERKKDFTLARDNKSVSRYFSAPANVTVTARFTYRREGNTDIPIIIELEKPDDASALSNRTLSGEDAAGATNRSVSISAISARFACGNDITWRARVRTADGDGAPAKIFGEIKFSYTDPSPINLDLEGTSLNLDRGISETKIFGVFNQPGRLRLKAKWHVPAIFPNTFARLSILVQRPDDSTANSSPRNYNSIHYNEGTNKFNIVYNVRVADVGSENWKLKITNNSDHNIENFNIEKGNDANPFVPAFKSTFTPGCF